MIYKYDNELYVPCELGEASSLFTSDGEYGYHITQTRETVPPSEWAVRCYGEHHDGQHHFRKVDLAMLRLVPCKPAECAFKFKLESLSFDDLTRVVANQKGLKWGDNHACWIVTPTDDTDLGNIDFEFPGATFTARLDKAVT